MPHKDPDVRREKQRQYSRNYYEKNRAKVIALAAKNKKLKTKRWKEYKKTLFCIKCGETHTATLDFHHTSRHKDNPKIHTLINNRGWESIMKEIEKCVVLCANCHRKLHHHEHTSKQGL